MFWRFGAYSTSNIDTLLENEEITLEEILNDQDIIQETKSQNPKLLEFLIKKENLTELVDMFFTLEGENQRLSIIACEILACEVQSLIDAIVIENKDILSKLWSFLDLPHSIEPEYSFQASYFCKIITTFLSKRTIDMLHFIQSQPVDRLLSHLQSSAIMDLVLTLIRLEELPEAKGIVQWFNDHGLLANLLDRLNPKLDSDEHFIAQQCLCEIIRMSQTSLMDSPSIGPNDLITELTGEEAMEKLIQFMLAPNSTSTLINGVTIIIDIIRHNNTDMNHESSFAIVLGYQQQFTPHSISLVPMLSVLTRHVEQLNDLLVKPKQQDTEKKALGLERLKICELFAESLHCSNMSSLNTTENQDTPTPGDLLKLEFVKHKVLPTCIELFFDFPWNNLLHYVVYDTLHQVFNGPMNRESNQQLITSTLVEGQLTQHILKAQEENDTSCAQPRGTRLGYMGHLTFISDEVIKLLESYPEMTQDIQKTMDLEAWRNYCTHQLEETKKRNNFTLGDHVKLTANIHPITSDEEEEEDWDHEYKSMNETSAGLVVSVHKEDDSSSDEEYHSSDGEEEQAWSKPDPWATKQQDPWVTKEEEEEDEQDPFGDFNEASEEINGFTSNFSDMDISEK